MKFLGEAVREALGTDDPTQVEDILNKDLEATWGRVREQYVSLQRPEVPKKQVGEYVPAWFLERQVAGFRDYDCEYFVARALLYAHRVAVVDTFAYYCDDQIVNSNEWARRHLETWKRIPPHQLGKVLSRALAFLPLEQLGLLHYLTPPTHKEPERTAEGLAVWSHGASDEDLETYFRDYLMGRDYYFRPNWQDPRDIFLARYAADMELGLASHELDRALRFFAKWQDAADVYTSAYRDIREGIQFLMLLQGQDLFVGAPNTDSSTLDALWNLPAFSESALRELRLGDVLALRDSSVFSKWRSSLQAATMALSSRGAISSSADVTDFLAVITGAEEAVLRKARRSRRLEGFFGDVRDFGISVALGGGGAGAGALVSGADLEAAIISGGIGVVASKLPALAGVAIDAVNGPKRVRAVKRYLALFGS